MSSGAGLRHPLTSLAALFHWYWGPCPFKASKNHSPKRKRKGKSAQFSSSSGAGLRHPPTGPVGRNTRYSLSSAPVPGTRSLVPPPCLPCNGVSVRLRLPKSTHQKKKTAPISFHPPGARGRGARVPPGRGLYLTPFARCWVPAGVDVVWMLSCVLWSLF